MACKLKVLFVIEALSRQETSALRICDENRKWNKLLNFQLEMENGKWKMRQIIEFSSWNDLIKNLTRSEQSF